MSWCVQGSIEHAGAQLEAYQALLQKEVIASFDKAVHQKDLGTMAECARVMSEFERGDAALMQVRVVMSLSFGDTYFSGDVVYSYRFSLCFPPSLTSSVLTQCVLCWWG